MKITEPTMKEIIPLAESIAKERMSDPDNFENGLGFKFVTELAENTELRTYFKTGNPIDFIMGAEAALTWVANQSKATVN